MSSRTSSATLFCHSCIADCSGRRLRPRKSRRRIATLRPIDVARVASSEALEDCSITASCRSCHVASMVRASSCIRSSILCVAASSPFLASTSARAFLTASASSSTLDWSCACTTSDSFSICTSSACASSCSVKATPRRHKCIARSSGRRMNRANSRRMVSLRPFVSTVCLRTSWSRLIATT